MKLFINFLLLFLSFNAYSQQFFNLDFEQVEKDEPLDWENFGSADYDIYLEKETVQSGKNAVVIEYSGASPDFRAWSYSIPAKYAGSKVKLTGYIKTENVAGGWAGLWLRVDPRVAFDNMKDRGVTGTTDWTKYEVELDLKPDQAERIVVGGLLVGTGKMWLDNLNVTIDGVALADAKKKELLPAQKDIEFDEGSNIDFANLNDQQINNLELLGKTWGFLKYHHPAIGKGKYNWDYELFRMLPTFLEAKTTAARDQVLMKWINKYGTVDICTDCPEVDKDAFLKPDFAWIDKSDLSKVLKEKLKFIRKNRHQGKHFYIGMSNFVGNPEFKHEKAYGNMPYPDTGFRVLALFKYWNMIQYFFPYKHLIDKDWNNTLKEYLPKFVDAKDELAYEFAMVQIIGDIQDTHANLWGGNNAIQEWKGKYYPPVHVRFIEDQLVVVDYYNPELKEKTGLELGDAITKINGKSVDEIIKEKHPYYPASNQPTRLRDISADILRADEKTLSISYVRDQKEENLKIDLYERDSLDIYSWYRRDDAKSYKLLDGNIGYVTLRTIKDEDIKPIREDFKNTKGIIIDIRNYPSTFVPFSLGSYFVEGSADFVKFTGGNVNTPGEFTFSDPLSIGNEATAYQGKLIVIVNELSQSQAEYTAMAFRAGVNTTVIGSTTAGADGNVSRIALPGGLSTMISGIGVYYPDGKETQKVGIVPDVVVQPSIKGIKAGKDEVLLKAIELINK